MSSRIMLRVKTKLSLAVGVLFALIVMLAGIGISRILMLANASDRVLNDNYNSLTYCQAMLSDLEKRPDTATRRLRENLAKQAANVTEEGEQGLTDKLSAHFSAWEKVHADSKSSAALLTTLRSDVLQIMQVNMEAIQRKEAEAKKNASGAITWIVVAAALCIVPAFLLMAWLPGNVGNPMRVLTENIQKIANKDYGSRISLKGGQEFRELEEAFNTMAVRLAEYEGSNLEKLLFEKKRIDAIIGNMHDPVIGLDEQNRFIFVNGQALQLMGLGADEINGRPIEDVASSSDQVRMLMQGILSPETDARPICITTDGKESFFQKEILDIHLPSPADDRETFAGRVILLKNITPFKELDSAKTNFIANVSHEIKTPISSIKMSLALLENEKVGVLNNEQQALVHSLHDDAQRLSRITNELLNITQLESGKISLNVVAAAPREMLDYAISANLNSATLKSIRLEVKAIEPLPKVLADREKTAWVLTNLISNAIRYSRENTVIELGICHDPTSPTLQFSVRDNGPGIAPEFREKIFERYFRIPGSSKEGTGLGLAISKEFVEAQGGTIQVESEFGSGATFIVRLKVIGQAG